MNPDDEFASSKYCLTNFLNHVADRRERNYAKVQVLMPLMRIKYGLHLTMVPFPSTSGFKTDSYAVGLNNKLFFTIRGNVGEIKAFVQKIHQLDEVKEYKKKRGAIRRLSLVATDIECNVKLI